MTVEVIVRVGPFGVRVLWYLVPFITSGVLVYLEPRGGVKPRIDTLKPSITRERPGDKGVNILPLLETEFQPHFLSTISLRSPGSLRRGGTILTQGGEQTPERVVTSK